MARLKKRANCLAFKMNVNFLRGFPDILVVLNGKTVYLELKYIKLKNISNRTKPLKNGLSAQQIYTLNQLYDLQQKTVVLICTPCGIVYLDKPEQWEDGFTPPQYLKTITLEEALFLLEQ